MQIVWTFIRLQADLKVKKKMETALEQLEQEAEK